jgi:hypothetical protein
MTLSICTMRWVALNSALYLCLPSVNLDAIITVAFLNLGDISSIEYGVRHSCYLDYKEFPCPGTRLHRSYSLSFHARPSELGHNIFLLELTTSIVSSMCLVCCSINLRIFPKRLSEVQAAMAAIGWHYRVWDVAAT